MVVQAHVITGPDLYLLHLSLVNAPTCVLFHSVTLCRLGGARPCGFKGGGLGKHPFVKGSEGSIDSVGKHNGAKTRDNIGSIKIAAHLIS